MLVEITELVIVIIDYVQLRVRTRNTNYKLHYARRIGKYNNNYNKV